MALNPEVSYRELSPLFKKEGHRRLCDVALVRELGDWEGCLCVWDLLWMSLVASVQETLVVRAVCHEIQHAEHASFRKSRS